MTLSDEDLLSQIEDAIRTMPPRTTIRHDLPENHGWFGRVLALVTAWDFDTIRTPLLIALATHVTMRLWSAFDFIPKALAFERADPASVDVRSARRWSRRSLGRLPLDVVTCTAMVVALLAAARNG